MDFSPTPRAADLTARVAAFIAEEIEPVEAAYHRDLAEQRRTGDPWQPLPVLEELKAKAREQGLWNLFLPKEHAGEYAARFGTDGGEGLTNVDYAPIAELTGRSAIAPLVFNCNAPDTGNMEVLLKYGTEDAARAVARAAAGREDPVGVHDDRARRRLLRRDQHGGHRGRRRRRDRDQRAQVVVDRRRQSGLQGASSSWGSPTPTRTGTTGTRWCWCRATPPACKVERMLNTMGLYDEPLGHGEVSFTDVRVPAGQRAARARARRSRSPRAGSGPAGSTTACG